MYRNPIPEDVWFHFHPVGGSLEMAFFENTLADAASLVKRDVVKRLGGFGLERHSWEDWEFFVRLVGAGFKHYVYPEPLIYYTHDPNGRNETARDFENRSSLFRTLSSLPPERAARTAQIFAQQVLLQRQLPH
jgi:GT2 family glycosyltransferase